MTLGHCCFAGCTLVICPQCRQTRCIRDFHTCPPITAEPVQEPQDEPTNLTCPDCGAVMGNSDAHIAWHIGLDGAIANAARYRYPPKIG